MLYSIDDLAILPCCHAAYSAQFLQIIRDILRGMLGEPLVCNGMETLLSSDDIPSDRGRLHPFRPQAFDITVKKWSLRSLP